MSRGLALPANTISPSSQHNQPIMYEHARAAGGRGVRSLVLGGVCLALVARELSWHQDRASLHAGGCCVLHIRSAVCCVCNT